MERQFEFNEFGVCTNPETVFEANDGTPLNYIVVKKYQIDNRWEHTCYCNTPLHGFGDYTQNNPYTPDLNAIILKIRDYLKTNPAHPCKAQFLAWADNLQKPTLF